MFTQLSVYTMNTHCSLFSRGRFVMFTVHLTHRLQNWGSKNYWSISPARKVCVANVLPACNTKK